MRWRDDFVIEHVDEESQTVPRRSAPCARCSYMYVLYSGGAEELYDLQADPYELRNQAASRTSPGSSRSCEPT